MDEVMPEPTIQNRKPEKEREYVNDLVLQEIDEFLACWQCAEVCSPFVLEDFSLQVRQYLGKIFRTKGAGGVKTALAMVRKYTEEMEGGQVDDWQDFLWSLLTGHIPGAPFLPPPTFSAP